MVKIQNRHVFWLVVRVDIHPRGGDRGKPKLGNKKFQVQNLKVGLGISRTNADSQWNPVYNVFHRNFCCGNETIRR